MPATSRSRTRSSSSRKGRGGTKGTDSTTIAMLGLAAAGGAYFLLKPKDAKAATLPAGSTSPRPAPRATVPSCPPPPPLGRPPTGQAAVPSSPLPTKIQ